MTVGAEPWDTEWAAQDAGEAVYCEECGRQLTFGEGEA